MYNIPYFKFSVLFEHESEHRLDTCRPTCIITMGDRRLRRLQLFLFVSITCAAILFFFVLHNWRQMRQIDCSTDTCKQISRQVNRSLNQSVSPCVDFGLYTCGNWWSPAEHVLETHDVHDDSYYKNTMQFILDRYKENPASFKHIRLFNEVIRFYKVCNNPELRDAGGYEPLRSLFESLGGFPLVSSNWNADQFHFEKALIQIHRQLKRNFLFNIEIRSHANGNQFVQVNKDVLYVENSTIWLTAYRQFIRHCVEALIESDYSGPDAEINEQIDQLIDFELALQNVSFAVQLNVDMEMFNYTTYEPTMDWANVLMHMIRDTSLFTVQPMNSIAIGRDTVGQLNRLLVNKRTFANFLCWQITRSFSESSTMQLLQAQQLFERQSSPGRWRAPRPLRFEIHYVNDKFSKKESSGRLMELCSRQTMHLFPVTFEHLINHFRLSTGLPKLAAILSRLSVILEQKLHYTNWADRRLISMIHSKLLELQVESSLTTQRSDTFCYEDFVTSNNFTESVINLRIFNYLNALCSQCKKKNIINIQKMNKGQKWNFDLQNRNTLPPNALLDAPNFWIMAKFGSIIGRNIINLFKTKSLQQSIQNRSLPLFHNRLACYRNKISNQVPFDQLALQDRDKLLFEYVAQSEGVDLAYEVFERLLTSNHKVRNVSGFQQLNLRQLFYISYVNGYCHYIVGNQYNSLFHHLINFSVQNSLNFASVFHCPLEGSVVNYTSAHSPYCSLFN